MKKRYYRLTRKPFDKTKDTMQTTSKASLDYGSINDLSSIDEFFDSLFKKESDTLKSLGLNPDSIFLKIEQLQN